MNYKPDEILLISYLYVELQGEEKRQVERYLAEHPEALKEVGSLTFVRKALANVPDKEVIAPPIVFDDHKTRYFWNTPFGRSLIGIAASVTLILLVGKLTGLNATYSNNTFTLRFGEPKELPVTEPVQPGLSAYAVQEMIDQSLRQNNDQWQAQWMETQQKLDQSIKTNLASRTDAEFNKLVQ